MSATEPLEERRPEPNPNRNRNLMPKEATPYAKLPTRAQIRHP